MIKSQESAYDAYTSWDWDMSLPFFENWSNVETLVREMGRKGCAAEVTPNRRQMFNRMKLKILAQLPAMQNNFDYVSRTGGSASGSGEIDMLKINMLNLNTEKLAK